MGFNDNQTCHKSAYNIQRHAFIHNLTSLYSKSFLFLGFAFFKNDRPEMKLLFVNLRMLESPYRLETLHVIVLIHKNM